jgi:hypothetical protein
VRFIPHTGASNEDSPGEAHSGHTGTPKDGKRSP